MSEFTEERYEPTTWEECAPLIEQIARTLSRRYPPVEYADIFQELAAYLWKAQARMLPRGVRWVNFELTRQGAKWCRKQRAEELNLTDQYYYTPEDVEQALEVYFSDDEWYTFRGPVDDKAFTSGQVIYANDALGGVVMLIDMRRVWDNLKLINQQTLYWVYAMGLDSVSLAEELEITADAASSRIFRAKTELLAALNKSAEASDKSRPAYEGPGARYATSNAAAIAQTRNTYDGGWTLVQPD